MKYDDTDIAERYQAARGLPEEVLISWLKPLEVHLEKRPRLTLDLGCGTGRFSEALGRAFTSRVVGIDLSATMLQKAKVSCDPALCWFVRGDAARVPVMSGSIELAFLSMVYHHVEPATVGCELRRVMKRGGVVGVRNSTIECLDKVLYCDFFPTAADHNRRHLPARGAVVTCMQDCGFALAAHHIINQTMASTWSEYCEKVALRTYSDLVQIPDEEFSRGMTAMRNSSFVGLVEEPIDLFVFRAA